MKPHATGVVIGVRQGGRRRSRAASRSSSAGMRRQARSSTWAPIAAPLAGKNRGALFMPEVGDEVLVAFEHGDFDHPYVVGFLWNGEDDVARERADNRVIVTPGGHQLRFEDKDGDTPVILKSNGGHELTLDDKAAGVGEDRDQVRRSTSHDRTTRRRDHADARSRPARASVTRHDERRRRAVAGDQRGRRRGRTSARPSVSGRARLGRRDERHAARPAQPRRCGRDQSHHRRAQRDAPAWPPSPAWCVATTVVANAVVSARPTRRASAT